jgi:hypothetical protein
LKTGAALLVLMAGSTLTTSCARAVQSPLPALSASDKYANAPALAAFVKRACVDTTAYPDGFAQMLDQTGWKHRQTAHGQKAGELSMWELPHVQLVHAATPLSAGQTEAWICEVSVDSKVAPQINRMETSLRRDVGNRHVFGSQPGDWHWKPSILTEAHLTINPGQTPDSLSIFVEYAELQPLKALFGK